MTAVILPESTDFAGSCTRSHAGDRRLAPLALAWSAAVGVRAATPDAVLAWGENANGQTVTPLAAQSGVVAIAAGARHTLALRKDGQVFAWGINGNGQCNVPAEALSGVRAIAGGTYHSVAVTQAGKVLAWGYNGYGQITVPLDALANVVSVAAGTTWRNVPWNLPVSVSTACSSRPRARAD